MANVEKARKDPKKRKLIEESEARLEPAKRRKLAEGQDIEKEREFIGVTRYPSFPSMIASVSLHGLPYPPEGSIHPLRDSFILDTGSTATVSNNLVRFTGCSESRHSVAAGLQTIPVTKEGSISIRLDNPGPNQPSRWIMHDALYIPGFPINAISEKVLRQHNIYYWAFTLGLYLVEAGQEPVLVASCTEMYGLLVLEFNPVEAFDSAFDSAFVMATLVTEGLYPADIPIPPPEEGSESQSQVQPPKATPRRIVVGRSSLWHERMAHPGPDALAHLPEATVGVKNVGSCPRGVECEVCAISKAH